MVKFWSQVELTGILLDVAKLLKMVSTISRILCALDHSVGEFLTGHSEVHRRIGFRIFIYYSSFWVHISLCSYIFNWLLYFKNTVRIFLKMISMLLTIYLYWYWFCILQFSPLEFVSNEQFFPLLGSCREESRPESVGSPSHWLFERHFCPRNSIGLYRLPQCYYHRERRRSHMGWI